jgi:hypothetical protein
MPIQVGRRPMHTVVYPPRGPSVCSPALRRVLCHDTTLRPASWTRDGCDSLSPFHSDFGRALSTGEDQGLDIAFWHVRLLLLFLIFRVERNNLEPLTKAVDNERATKEETTDPDDRDFADGERQSA